MIETNVIQGQFSILDLDLQYKIEAVYIKIFGIRKFKNYIRDKKLEEIVDYLRFQGEYYLGVGWSERNSTIINLSPDGIRFNDEEKIYSHEEIAEMLIDQFSEDQSA